MSLGGLRQKISEQNITRVLVIAGTFLFSVAILGVLVYRERTVFLNFDWQFRWRFLFHGFWLFTFSLIVAGLLWADTMRVLGSTIPTRLHVRYYCISHIAKRIPGSVWYVASRGYFYKKHNEMMRRVTIAAGLEFVVLFLAGVFISLIAVFYSLVEISKRNIIGLVILAVISLLVIHPRSIKWLMQRIDLTELPDWRYVDILRWLIGYALLYVIGGVVFFWIGNAVTPIALEHLPFVIGAWSLIGTLSFAVFFLPSNLGFNEVGLSLLLSTIISSSMAVLIAVLLRLVQIVYELIGVGLIVLFLREDDQEKRLKKEGLSRR